MTDAGEVGVELFEAAGAVLAKEHEDQVEQVLESGLVEQGFDVGALVVGGDEQRRVGVCTERIGSVASDGDDFAAALAELAADLIERRLLALL